MSHGFDVFYRLIRLNLVVFKISLCQKVAVMEHSFCKFMIKADLCDLIIINYYTFYPHSGPNI